MRTEVDERWILMKSSGKWFIQVVKHIQFQGQIMKVLKFKIDRTYLVSGEHWPPRSSQLTWARPLLLLQTGIYCFFIFQSPDRDYEASYIVVFTRIVHHQMSVIKRCVS